MRLHACHGVLEQERIVGNDYVVNLIVDYPLQQACESDDVADTLDYSVAAAIIREEMATPSKLLENVAHRIAYSIIRRFPATEAVEVDILKIAPPMQADTAGAGVRVKTENSHSGDPASQ